MQYFVMSIKKTLVYFSGMEYHPTVTNGEQNPASCIIGSAGDEGVDLEEGGDVAKHDETEDLVEHSQRPDELRAQDMPDKQYLDEQDDTFLEQAMNELDVNANERDMHVHVVDEHFDIVINKPLDSDQAIVAENVSISAADNFTAPNVDEQDDSSCMTNQDSDIGEEIHTCKEVLHMCNRIAETVEEFHQNDCPMDTWPDLSTATAGAVKVATNIVNIETGEVPMSCTDKSISVHNTVHTLSVVTLDATDLGEEQDLVPSVTTLVNNDKPTAVAVVQVSESTSFLIGSAHPISYKFIAKNFTYQVSRE